MQSSNAMRNNRIRPIPCDRQPGGLNLYLVSTIAALGGFLFGYDTGVVSGAQLYFVKTFNLSSTMEEIAVAAVLIGAVIGALTGGKLADAISRKFSLMVIAVIFVLGTVVTALAPAIAWFIIGRIVVGLAVGSASVVAPMYTTELAPAEHRGQMVFLFQLAVTVGIAVSYWVDLAFSSAGLGWRPMFAVGIVPAVILGIGMFTLPRTPRWLASKDLDDEAECTLRGIVGDAAPQALRDIRRSIDAQKSANPGELLRPGLRLALVAGLGLAILQQFVGINTIIYYAPTIFGYAGIHTASTAILASTVVGMLNVVSTVVAVLLVDRVGRRPLLLCGTAGMFVALALTGSLFAIGPQNAGVLLLLCVLLYIISFAIGMGPVFWLLSEELFPTRLRGTGASISATGNWGANLLVSITFLSLIAALGKPLTFWLYAGFAVVAFVFTWFLVPETNGKTLEDIEAYWQNGRTWSAPEEEPRRQIAQ